MVDSAPGPCKDLVLFWIKSALFSITFICAVFLVYTVGPWVETKYFPVLEKLQIVSVQMDGVEQSLVYTAFTKLRDCGYVGTAWYWKREDGSLERVPFASIRKTGDTSSPNRALGYQRAGPWQIGMPAPQIVPNSVVEIFHSCWPFWTTRTAWYP